MRKIAFLLFANIILNHVTAQNAVDCAVQITASVQNTPPQITLNWIGNASTAQYTVFRKLKNAITWGTAIATLNGTVTNYVDNSVVAGTSYEYRIQRTGSSYTGHGYINSGIEVPAIENRGRLILIIDSLFTAPLAVEINRLIEDLEGDGWQVARHDVLRTSSVTHVKSVIVNSYNQNPVNTKALFLLGHIPVPYSGNINPDGHTDHQGAWPTDMYYADIDGNWTDVSVTSTNASPARTQNIPGDGKFDQSIRPSLLELQTGRVDLSNLTSFTLTETQLMKNYLDKDHDYRKKIYVPVKRGVIDDNFGYMSGEAFAASGYNAMAACVGSSSITIGDYFGTMSSGSYQWSYGCGGGSFTSASGIGNTGNFASANLEGVFTMLFGSYFGDWDITNSFLRAPLAQGKILTNVWSGRPHYNFHHMAMGENIGYSILTTQNYQQSLYFPNIYNIHGGWIHNGLMGDPSLRNDVVAPVSNVTASMNGYNCVINWSVSPEPGILGYHIYRRDPSSNAYLKLNANLLSGTSFTDACIPSVGIYKYMVRAEKLETSATGTYYNLSEGISDTAWNVIPAPNVYAQFIASVSGTTVNTINNSSNATSYNWNFGNGIISTSVNPSATYTANGSYTITLIATGACSSDTSTTVVNITSVGLKDYAQTKTKISVYPNPAKEKIYIQSDFDLKEIRVLSIRGELLYKISGSEEINTKEWSRGIYFIQAKDTKGNISTIKLILD
jgi:PKD repeat protein